jgi:hypothetical protein
MVTPGRLITPYYPLLLPALLVGAEQSALVRKSWWRGLMWLTFLAAFLVLIVTPPRPLWPAKTILAKLQATQPDNRLINRALATYTAYSIRWDPLAEVRALLPPDLKVIGMVAGPDDLDISFWRPFGTRRVAHFGVHEDGYEQIKARQVQYIIVSELHLQMEKIPLADWLTKAHGEVLTNATATITVSTGPQKWYVVRIKDDQPPARITPR